MSMGGWHHRGANVTARVVVPDGWMDPAERWKAQLMAQIEARRLAKQAQESSSAESKNLDNKPGQ